VEHIITKNRTMNFKDKSWFSSKTFWVSVVTFGIGGAQALGYAVPSYALEMLMALGLYSLRDAVGTSGS